jgi:hypothetical protein
LVSLIRKDSRFTSETKQRFVMEKAELKDKRILFICKLDLKILLLLLLVFSPWASLGRNQSPVRRPVWLWYTASWASS